MEKFNVQLLDITYTIEPLADGTFRIWEEAQSLGIIYPEAGNLGLEWKTMDDMETGFVDQLGELITEHEMGNTIL